MKRFISYLAINMALLSFAFGQSVRGEYRSTLVWTKRPGGWHLVSNQLTALTPKEL